MSTTQDPMVIEQEVIESSRSVARDVVVPSLVAAVALSVSAALAPVVWLPVLAGGALGVAGAVGVFLLKLHNATRAFVAAGGEGVRTTLKFSFVKQGLFAGLLLLAFVLPEWFRWWAVLGGMVLPTVVLIVTQVRHVRREG